jgi:hypothetical protein
MSRGGKGGGHPAGFWGLQAGRLPVGCVRTGVVVVVGKKEREQRRRKKKNTKA